jgi:hypothetical protein
MDKKVDLREIINTQEAGGYPCRKLPDNYEYPPNTCDGMAMHLDSYPEPVTEAEDLDIGGPAWGYIKQDPRVGTTIEFVMDAKTVPHQDVKLPVDMVNHPPHYTSHPSGVECIEITRYMGFNLGNAFKYIWRADLKGDSIEDLEKAIFYLKDEIQRLRG